MSAAKNIKHIFRCHIASFALLDASLQRLTRSTQKSVLGPKAGTHVIAEPLIYRRKKVSEKETGTCTSCKKECDSLSEVGSRGSRRVTLCEDCMTWEARLTVKYSDLLSNCYPCVGEGWSNLLEAMCAHIEHYLKYTGKAIIEDGAEPPLNGHYMHSFYFCQIKEKFGGLRAYFNGGDDFISGVITFAETMSYEICETCGGKGKLRRTAWNSTLCDKHYEERVIFDNAKR